MHYAARSDDALYLLDTFFRAAASVDKYVEGRLVHEAEITRPQLRVLRLLRRYPADNFGVRSIAKALGWSASNASRIVERLSVAGYVVREERPDDRRTFFVRMTSCGEQALGVGERALTEIAHTIFGVDPEPVTVVADAHGARAPASGDVSIRTTITGDLTAITAVTAITGDVGGRLFDEGRGAPPLAVPHLDDARSRPESARCAVDPAATGTRLSRGESPARDAEVAPVRGVPQCDDDGAADQPVATARSATLLVSPPVTATLDTSRGGDAAKSPKDAVAVAADDAPLAPPPARRSSPRLSRDVGSAPSSRPLPRDVGPPASTSSAASAAAAAAVPVPVPKSADRAAKGRWFVEAFVAVVERLAAAAFDERPPVAVAAEGIAFGAVVAALATEPVRVLRSFSAFAVERCRTPRFY